MDEIFKAEAWEKLWTYRSTFLTGFGNTLRTAAAALVLALALGFLFGLMASSRRRLLRAIARVYVECIQNTPVVLQMCFLYYALAFSGVKTDIIATGIAALGVYTGAYMAEVVRAGIAAIPKGQFEAAETQGFSTVQTMAYIVLPQAYRAVVPTLLSQVISTVKDSSYLANLACIELMSRVRKILATSNMFNGVGRQMVSDVFVLFGLAFVIYFVINFALSCAVRRLQKPRIRKKQEAAA